MSPNNNSRSKIQNNHVIKLKVSNYDFGASLISYYVEILRFFWECKLTLGILKVKLHEEGTLPGKLYRYKQKDKRQLIKWMKFYFYKIDGIQNLIEKDVFIVIGLIFCKNIFLFKLSKKVHVLKLLIFIFGIAYYIINIFWHESVR